MKKAKLFLLLIFLFSTASFVMAQSDFGTSLHSTRNGKPTWYDKENGGFETLTNVPIEDIGCVGCHDATDANGDPYPEDYTPGCVDCHNSDFAVTQDDCLGCHGREKAIIGMTQYSDVHRTAGMTCMDCHKTETVDDLHGDGTEYLTMFDPGAISADCENCHSDVAESGHGGHGGKLHCTTCHTETNLSCYNCHFESQVESHVKRAKQKITGFQILVNREKDGKVHPATFQSLSYEGKTWIAMGPSVAHTVVKEGKVCADCHANMGGEIEAITDYNEDGIIQFASWNSDDSTLSWTKGIVPLPENYASSFKIDFIKYDGNTSDPAGASKNWTFVKGEADGFQLLYATPLSKAQMAKLGMDTTLTDVRQVNDTQIPSEYELGQNYPNPFNPTTTINYSIPQGSFVEVKVYDVVGNLIETLVSKDQSAGSYQISFEANDLSSGIYFYNITADNFVQTKKMILMK